MQMSADLCRYSQTGQSSSECHMVWPWPSTRFTWMLHLWTRAKPVHSSNHTVSKKYPQWRTRPNFVHIHTSAWAPCRWCFLHSVSTSRPYACSWWQAIMLYNIQIQVCCILHIMPQLVITPCHSQSMSDPIFHISVTYELTSHHMYPESESSFLWVTAGFCILPCWIQLATLCRFWVIVDVCILSFIFHL